MVWAAALSQWEISQDEYSKVQCYIYSVTVSNEGLAQAKPIALSMFFHWAVAPAVLAGACCRGIIEKAALKPLAWSGTVI